VAEWGGRMGGRQATEIDDIGLVTFTHPPRLEVLGFSWIFPQHGNIGNICVGRIGKRVNE
jgi:hypothetical protein